MPRNASGTYTLPSGNPVEAGTLIEANWANTTLQDVGNELTNSLSRTGEGGMLAPFRLADGTLGAPGIAWLNEPSTGFYRYGTGEMWGVVQGTQVLQYTANGILVPTGRTFTAQGNASVGGNLTVTGTLAITGGVSFTGNATVGGTLGVTGATTLSSTLAVTGAITATGGVSGNVTGNLTGNVTGNVSGNAGTVTNGLYSTGSYADPTWLTSLAAAKLTGQVAVATGGTGASTASAARANLGLVIGTDVPSPTGTGASGTWGINISGNAATATSATSASTATTATNLSGGTVSATTGTFSSTLSVTGATTLASDLTLSGASKRIYGDFTNATNNSRVLFQTSTANSSTSVGALPSGTSNIASFDAYNASDTTNAAIARLLVNATQASLRSVINGTGTYLPLTFWAAGSERFRLDATTGNFLVGTQTDDGSNKLQVTGNTALTGALSVSGNTTLSGGTANGVLYLNGSKVATSGSALTFDGASNFSYGGSNASTYNTLNVNNTSATGFARILFNVGSSGANGIAAIKYAPGVFMQIGPDANDTTTPLVFAVNNGSEQMRLTSTGLGIGTSSPATRLSVDNTRSDTAGTGWFTYTNAAVTSGKRGMRVDTNNGYWFDYYNGSTWSAQMGLDSSGNLGLGVTPSAWGLGKAFEIGIAGNCVWGVQSADLRLGANMRYDGSNYRYVNNGVAARYDVANGTLGGHAWYTAASGTAGNAISFTQALTLHASGGLSLGNTSDPGATNLSVTGTAKAGIVHLGGNYTAGATTPSVTGISYMPISNSSATTITNFTGAVTGQIIYLYFADANTTITRANARLAGSTNFTSTQYATLALLYNGTEWIEICRSTTNG